MDPIIKDAKKSLRTSDLHELNSCVKSLYSMEYGNNVYTFKTLFLEACRYSNMEVIIYLVQAYFDGLSDMEQISLRQMFIYGKYRTSNNIQIDTNEYNDNILPLFRSITR